MLKRLLILLILPVALVAKPPAKTSGASARVGLKQFNPVTFSSTLWTETSLNFQNHAETDATSGNMGDPGFSVEFSGKGESLGEVARYFRPILDDALAPLGLKAVTAEEWDAAFKDKKFTLTEFGLQLYLARKTALFCQPKDQASFEALMSKVKLVGHRDTGKTLGAFQRVIVAVHLNHVSYMEGGASFDASPVIILDGLYKTAASPKVESVGRGNVNSLDLLLEISKALKAAAKLG